MSKRARRKERLPFGVSPIEREMLYGNGSPMTDKQLAKLKPEYDVWAKAAFVKYIAMTDARREDFTHRGLM